MSEKDTDPASVLPITGPTVKRMLDALDEFRDAFNEMWGHPAFDRHRADDDSCERCVCTCGAR